jgi:uncharacterized membrane protein YkoI
MSPTTRTKLLTVSVTVTMIVTAIVVTAFLSSSTIPIQKASAQMMAQPPVGRMGPGMMMSAPNITGSVNLTTTIGNALASQIKISLSQAADAAEKAVGNNSHSVSAHLGQANGYLVYTVLLVDSSYKFHKAIVDVGNGKVLSSQQLPMRPGMMMGHMMGGMGPSMMGSFHP